MCFTYFVNAWWHFLQTFLTIFLRDMPIFSSGANHCIWNGLLIWKWFSLFSARTIISAFCIKDGWNLFYYCFSVLNECLSNPCFNGGTCYDLFNYYICDCPEGVTNDHCQTGNQSFFFLVKDSIILLFSVAENFPQESWKWFQVSNFLSFIVRQCPTFTLLYTFRH